MFGTERWTHAAIRVDFNSLEDSRRVYAVLSRLLISGRSTSRLRKRQLCTPVTRQLNLEKALALSHVTRSPLVLSQAGETFNNPTALPR